ncbi:MAG: MarR family transcriptional regulator [Chloroflexi bacterium]|nr:MarR family transcriptional regulator [Chloroflexota bacterium]
MDRNKIIEEISSEFSYFMPIWRKYITKDYIIPDLADKGISMQHIYVLIELNHQGPLPISHAGTFFYISKSDMTRIADRLQELGFIERIPSTEDRRIINITLTNKGLDFIARVGRNKLEKFKQVLKECDEIELIALRNLFKRFIDKENSRIKL